MDWTLWTATLTGDRAILTLCCRSIGRLNTATGREPFNDVYETASGKTGWMISRPVIGGVFLKALDDPALWKKRRGVTRPARPRGRRFRLRHK